MGALRPAHAPCWSRCGGTPIRTHIFCQAGQIHVPKEEIGGFSATLRSLVSRCTPSELGWGFPSQTLDLRFQPAERVPSKEWPIVYRLLCPSRNITFDVHGILCWSWKASSSARRKLEEMEPLCSFITRLPEYAVRACT